MLLQYSRAAKQFTHQKTLLVAFSFPLTAPSARQSSCRLSSQ